MDVWNSPLRSQAHRKALQGTTRKFSTFTSTQQLPDTGVANSLAAWGTLLSARLAYTLPCEVISSIALRGQMAEQLGNRAINQKVAGSIPGRAK